MSTLKQPCCTQDEGRPLAAALQEEAANHLTLRGSRARVVSGEETARQDCVRYGSRRRAQANHCGGVESVGTTSKLEPVVTPGGVQESPAYCLSGVWHKDGVSVIQACVWNGEPVASMPREPREWWPHQRQSTDARHRGGTPRSSAEASVRGGEQRGCSVPLSCWSTSAGRNQCRQQSRSRFPNGWCGRPING